jgi:hypothetical protein
MNMVNFQQGLATFEISLNIAVILIYVIQRCFSFIMPIQQRIFITILIILIFLWPSSGLPFTLPLAAYVRGVTGEFSLVTSLLLWSWLFINARLQISASFKLGIILTGLIFYPLALGFSMIDPYAWGYGSLPFFIAIILITFCLWWIKMYREVTLIALAILAWSLTIHETTNLWDYLLDPFIFLWCIATICIEKINFTKIRNYIKIVSGRIKISRF